MGKQDTQKTPLCSETMTCVQNGKVTRQGKAGLAGGKVYFWQNKFCYGPCRIKFKSILKTWPTTSPTYGFGRALSSMPYWF